MSIGLRRPSIREHPLTYLLELLASIQRHGLKALHPTPSPHYLDHWAEPVQIRVSHVNQSCVNCVCPPFCFFFLNPVPILGFLSFRTNFRCFSHWGKLTKNLKILKKIQEIRKNRRQIPENPEKSYLF